MRAFESPRSVLVVGLDGATFRLLGPWLEDGELPCLSRLYHRGVRGPLKSTVPALSPESWTTFMTGKHPGQHGVMNFLSFRPRSYELQFNNGALIRGKTLWRLLSDAGKRVGVLGVPMTYPPEPVNGYLVAGLETPGARSQFAHPPELCAELRAAIGGYDLHGDFADHADSDAYLRRILAMIDNQARAACYLFQRYPSDLSVMVIGATDRAQHFFWRFSDPTHPGYDPDAPRSLATALKRVFQQVDRAVDAVMRRLPEPRTVLVMSDHGFGPCHKLIHLNRWLEQQGYLVCAPRSTVGFRVVRALWGQACRHAPRWLKDCLKNALPSVRSQITSMLLLSRIDWRRTKAFAVSTQHSYLYLNRRDRFPYGTVRPGEEADRICEELAAGLKQLRDPDTGVLVVADVFRTTDLYPCPAADALPDMIVMWREGYVARSEAVERLARGSPRRSSDVLRVVEPMGGGVGTWSGSHRQDGILIAHGHYVAGPKVIQDARLVDLAPTLLHLLGEPVPEEMAGRVLEELFAPDFLAACPVRYCSAEEVMPGPVRQYALSSADRRELAERLRNLGYME